MAAEWFRNLFKQKKYCPSDGNKYIISSHVLEYTARILTEYGGKGAEGIVYWAGHIDNGTYTISAAVAPRAAANRRDIFTSHESNAQFVEFISDHDLIYIAQVHSHPFKWVDHSDVDNEETAFRSEGLISIVVPYFGKLGMLPLKICGVHRFDNGSFHRLANTYIKRRFRVKTLKNYVLKDLRYE